MADFKGDKVLGPDGFLMGFWHISWDFVKEDVLRLFNEFHNKWCFLKSTNATFLVLVPKKGGPEDLKDYRPISLVGGLYKRLAKVLANRLKGCLSKVISKAQNAFVEGRQILDAMLVANEVFDSVVRGNSSAIMCKLDLEKAYDHVNRSFLISMLTKMGFGKRWIRWISWCISLTSFFVMINGSPFGFFQSSRGLHQVDPLSPYLFVTVMKAFSQLLKRAVDGDFISACNVGGFGREGVKVSHLLFPNDTLVFVKDDHNQLTFLSWLLMWFEALSGLKINLGKNELITIGRVEGMELLATEFGCKVGRLPSTYLGLPLGARYKSIRVWDNVEESFRKR